MKADRKPFQPLSADLDDRIETLAREKGVGALVRPDQGEQGPSVAAVASPAPAPAPEVARSRMKAVNLELPDYVWTELKILAVERETSVRHVVMKALQRDGITISDKDMIEDGRRIRGKRTQRTVRA